MAVDYLSAINSQGSGLNVTQIVDGLVDAEVQPKRTQITNSQSETELLISELASLKSRTNTFEALNNALDFKSSFEISNANPASFDITPDDNSQNLEPFNATLKVKQLAQRQTLSFAGYASSDSALGDVNLTISFGTLSSSNVFALDNTRSTQSVTLTGTTLIELSNELDKLEGVSSEVIQIASGNYALAVYSKLGNENSLSISGHNDFTVAVASDYDTHQVTAAKNATIELNGIELSRDTNSIDDLIPGTTVNLISVSSTSDAVSGLFSSNLAAEKMKAFVADLNDLKGYLMNVSKRDAVADNGIFASDAMVRNMITRVNTLLRTPIVGFGASEKYLAEMGVATNRDGTLSFNEAEFAEFFKNNRTAVLGVAKDNLSSDVDAIAVEVGKITSQTNGNFSFEYDAVSGIATLDGVQLTSTISGDQTIFTSTKAGFETMKLKMLTSQIPSSATVSIGESFTSKFSSLLREFLDSNGDFDEKQKSFDDKLDTYQEELIELDEKEDAIRTRYTEQFMNMERMVTKLKSTGDYITNLMEAWKKENN